MSDLNQQFLDAVAGSKSLSSRPDNETMLNLYALYKQGTQGDAPHEAPGDMMGMFKHKAIYNTICHDSILLGPFSLGPYP